MLPEPTKKAEQADNTNTSTNDALVSAVNTNSKTGTDLSNAAKKGTKEVSSGGTRNTQITINLNNLVENANFNGSVGDNQENIINQFTELLLRTLYSAQTAV